MDISAPITVSPEAVNALVVAVVGSISAYLIARFNAKKQDQKDDHSDESRFRGELRDDNKALRQEVWDLKNALREAEDTVDRLRSEAQILRDSRMASVSETGRKVRAEEDATEALQQGAGAIDRSGRVDLGPRPL